MSDYYTNEEEQYKETQDVQRTGNGRVVRKRKKRRKKHYLLKLLIFLLFCAGTYVFLHSSLFEIETIRVSNTKYVTSDEIQTMAGVKKKMNLFDFRAGKAERTLESDPYIQKADVSRKLPATVTIEVEERMEVGVIQGKSRYLIVDKEGVVLRVSKQKPELVLLEGLTVTADVGPGGTLQVKEKAAYKRTLEVLGAIQRNNLNFETLDASKTIVEIHVRDKLFCRGKTKNLVIGMEEYKLQKVLNNLKKRGVKKGRISVGDNQYFSFNKKLK